MEKKNDMGKVWSVLFQQISNQGLSFILLATMVYYFQTETAHLQDRIDQCNERVITLIQDENQHNREVIKKNTKAIEDFGVFLRNYTER